MTALQELLNCIPTAEEIKEYISEYQPDTKMLDEWLWERIYKNKNWIEKEKQQIIEAYDLGSLENLQYPDSNVINNGEEYYNKTYNQ